MIEPVVLNSRGKNMLCLIEYKSPEDKGRKVVLFRHDFCSDMSGVHGLMTGFSHILTEEGYTVVRFDSVGAGLSEGDSTDVTIQSEIEDLKLVLHHIKDEFHPEKLLILGYGLGGLEAAVCAGEVELNGLILWSPYSNAYTCIRYMLGDELFYKGMEEGDICFEGYSIGQSFFENIENMDIDPLSKLQGFDKPVYILHGTDDDRVFQVNSQIYKDNIEQAELELIQGANHSFDELKHQEELWDRTLKHIKELLG